MDSIFSIVAGCCGKLIDDFCLAVSEQITLKCDILNRTLKCNS